MVTLSVGPGTDDLYPPHRADEDTTKGPEPEEAPTPRVDFQRTPFGSSAEP
jgi:hypothetical protein